MKRQIYRLISMITAFQLFWSCGASNLNKLGQGGSGIIVNLRGTITQLVKPIEGLSNLIMPSAVAAVTGTVTAYDYTNYNDPKALSSVDLHDGAMTYTLPVDSALLDGKLIRIIYLASDSSKYREIFADGAELVGGNPNLDMDPTSTVQGAFVRSALKDNAAANYDDALSVLDNTTYKDYDKYITTGFTDEKRFVELFKDPSIALDVVDKIEYADANAYGETSFYFTKVVSDAELIGKNNYASNGKLDCTTTPIKVTVTEGNTELYLLHLSSDSADFAAAFGGNSMVKSMEFKDQAKADAAFDEIYNKFKTTTAGTYAHITLVKSGDVNSALFGCYITNGAAGGGKAVYAVEDFFNKIDVKAYKAMADLTRDLDTAKNDTLLDLVKKLEANKLAKDGAEYKADAAVVDSWYKKRVDDATAIGLK